MVLLSEDSCWISISISPLGEFSGLLHCLGQNLVPKGSQEVFAPFIFFID